MTGSKISGGSPRVFLEDTEKVLHGIETGLKGDVLDFQVGGGKHLLRLINPKAVEILYEGNLQLLLEEATEV